MPSSVFLTRVVLRNYKSIAACDVRLGPLTYLLGPNGSGKSNFLDALHLVADALNGSLDHALNQRGGLNEVRRRSSGRPNHFGIRLEFQLPVKPHDIYLQGFYAFWVGALKGGGYEVQDEECVIGLGDKNRGFKLQRGNLVATSEASFPAVTSDRLGLVAASGLPAFRPVFDALTAMGFYNLDPKLMRELQKPQEGRLLKPSGENIASVVRHLVRTAPETLELVSEYLHAVVPMVQGVEHKSFGPMETLEFRQDVAGSESPWRFPAQGMSDGTLRVFGALVALFQGVGDDSVRLVGIEEPETALHPAAFAALREALQRAAEKTQVLVTSHSPDLLDDSGLSPATLLAVVSEGGESRIAPIDAASRQMLEEHLFTTGELMRLNQLGPDREAIPGPGSRPADLFEALPPPPMPVRIHTPRGVE
ncbi:AAA family ATPase [uncultured Thiodictyon sp.]|jgi:predicted ATPase|uniref:AAA family ATPase n=1 Tax=uncultured Thiodictyon sp. TaxID=1846217 RepID=UPI0025F6A88C|nr:AAA family ATPase [uncultured Thiodictyon sp.]